MARPSFGGSDSPFPSPSSSPSASPPTPSPSSDRPTPSLLSSPNPPAPPPPPPPPPRKKRPCSGDGVRTKPFRGVRRRSWGKWVSEIRQPRKRSRIWLGSYSTPEAAAQAYDMALYYLRGPVASLNFPTLIPQEPPPELSPRSVQQKAIAAGLAADKKGGAANNSAVLANSLPAMAKGKIFMSRSTNSLDSCSSSPSHPNIDASLAGAVSAPAPNVDMRALFLQDEATAVENLQERQQHSCAEPAAHPAHAGDASMRAAYMRIDMPPRQSRPLTFNLNEAAPEEDLEAEQDEQSRFYHRNFGDADGVERLHAGLCGTLMNGLECKARPFTEFLAPRSSSASM